MTRSEAGASSEMRECAQCGLICTLPRMRPELVADCPRCSHTLWRMRRRPFEFPIACGLAALLFYIYAIIAPFLEITAYGRFSQARMETGPCSYPCKAMNGWRPWCSASRSSCPA